MSSSFTFSANDGVQISKDDSPFTSADDDVESTVSYIDGTITVDISTSYSTHLNILGQLRNGTGTGMPEANRGYAKDEQDSVNDSSMAGEGGLHIAYDEWILDERIIENGGDGGIDGTLEIDGEMFECDVKCPTSKYDDSPWLKVRADKHTSADVYILASYNDGIVTYHGWIHSDDLCTEENRSSVTGMDNYILTDICQGGDISDLNDMPEPTTDREICTTRFSFSS